MKNSFYTNFAWLGIIILFLTVILLCSCQCGYYCFAFSPRTEGILIGILSSAILLFLAELILFLTDRVKYGSVQGFYYRKSIYQVNENRVRGSAIPVSITNESKEIEKDMKKEAREKIELEKGVKYFSDSVYHELLYYRCSEQRYLIKLKYQFHGIYTGFVEYFDDYPYDDDWKIRPVRKVKTSITLNLNLANPMTGVGSYKYYGKEDYGEYKFHINEETKDEIIIYHQNVIPSGLAEGYEIWEKIK